MNIKKVSKILTTVLIMMMVVSITLATFAASEPKTIKPSGTVQGENEIVKVGGTLVGILQTVGIVLSVVILIVIGIKYMMGSAEEKAEYKKTMMPYIIGAALIFAASALAQIIFQFFTGMAK